MILRVHGTYSFNVAQICTCQVINPKIQVHCKLVKGAFDLQFDKKIFFFFYLKCLYKIKKCNGTQSEYYTWGNLSTIQRNEYKAVFVEVPFRQGVGVVVVVWQLHLQLSRQSVPITTKVVSSNHPAHGEAYSIQHYVIKWFFLGTPVSSINKTDHHDILEILLKMVLNTINNSSHSPKSWNL